jgi:hypothetical protein
VLFVARTTGAAMFIEETRKEDFVLRLHYVICNICMLISLQYVKRTFYVHINIVQRNTSFQAYYFPCINVF